MLPNTNSIWKMKALSERAENKNNGATGTVSNVNSNSKPCGLRSNLLYCVHEQILRDHIAKKVVEERGKCDFAMKKADRMIAQVVMSRLLLDHLVL